MYNSNNRLFQIDLMRVIVIILLILMHCLTMYSVNNASWDLPNGIVRIPAYQIGQKLSYAFLLESFTFMSGFVYFYSTEKKGNIGSFTKLIKAKAKRLLLPSFVFSVFFYFLFRYDNNISVRTFYDITIGMGHMWYLPMLFSCFIITYWIERNGLPIKIVLGILFLFSAVSFCVPNYLRLSQTIYYEFFFYLGGVCFRYNIRIKKYWQCLLILVVAVPGLLLIKELLPLTDYTFINKLSERVITIGYGLIGTHALYSLCDICVEHINTKWMSYVVKISTLSMGIYLFQEFIIRIFYYKTSLSQYLGSYGLPWCVFILTFLLSFLLAESFRKNRIGKFLIG